MEYEFLRISDLLVLSDICEDEASPTLQVILEMVPLSLFSAGI